MKTNTFQREKNVFDISKSICMKPTLMFFALFFLTVFNSSIASGTEQTAPVLSLEEMKRFASEIREVESRIKNMKIESEAWIEEKVSLDLSVAWQRTPVCVSATSWFDGNPQKKARIDVHKEVLRWMQSVHPYSEKSYSMGFDGQTCRVAYHTVGTPTNMTSSREGKILPNASKNLTSEWFRRVTGLSFTTNFFFHPKEGYTFSDLFAWATDPNSVAASTFELSYEEFQGANCIKISTKTNERGWRKDWWLNPNQGFALLGHDYIDVSEYGQVKIIRSIRVDKLEQVATGIWWPMKVSMISRPSGEDKPYERFVYNASRVIVNNPNFDDSVFTITFPTGYMIDDKVQGKTYRVGQE